MKNIKELKDKFENKRPVSWEMIPDIPLNKNQVVMYMPRQLVGTEGDDDITAAMINNYIKDEVMPRANGKTYGREHIAYLTAISVLKKSLQVKDIKALIDLSENGRQISERYSVFNEMLDKELSEVSGMLKDGMSEEELTELALKLAISVYARRALCEQIVECLTAERKEKKEEKKEKPKEMKNKAKGVND